MNWDFILHIVSMYILPALFILLLLAEFIRLIAETIKDIVGYFCPNYSRKERRK